MRTCLLPKALDSEKDEVIKHFLRMRAVVEYSDLRSITFRGQSHIPRLEAVVL